MNTRTMLNSMYNFFIAMRSQFTPTTVVPTQTGIPHCPLENRRNRYTKKNRKYKGNR